jgi:hypothetical protein
MKIVYHEFAGDDETSRAAANALAVYDFAESSKESKIGLA